MLDIEQFSVNYLADGQEEYTSFDSGLGLEMTIVRESSRYRVGIYDCRLLAVLPERFTDNLEEAVNALGEMWSSIKDIKTYVRTSEIGEKTV